MLESKVREFVRELWGDRAYFIEPKPGSTAGMPDCYIQTIKGGFFLELKVAVFSPAKNHYKIKHRPLQNECMKRIDLHGGSACYLAMSDINFVMLVAPDAVSPEGVFFGHDAAHWEIDKIETWRLRDVIERIMTDDDE
jgi:hypothetical protein